MERAIWGIVGLIGLLLSTMFLQGAGFQTKIEPVDLDEIIPVVVDSIVPVVVPVVLDSVLTQVPEQIHWAMQPSKAAGEYYLGGFYKHASGSEDFNPQVVFGEANNPYAAHLYFVAGPVLSGPDTLVCVGVSVADSAAVVTNPDTVLVVFEDGDPENTYKQTAEKWLGAVTITNADGTPRLFNYGFAEYFDNDDTDFIVKSFKSTWVIGSTDENMTVRMYYHGASASWDYQSDGPAVNQAYEDMQTDYGSLSDGYVGEPGSWEKTKIDSTVAGSDYGGVLVSVITSTSDAISFMNFTLRITQLR
jgi:hypothetical protein